MPTLPDAHLEPETSVLEDLGSGWVLCQKQNISGDIFFFNCETNEVSVNPPKVAGVASPPDAFLASESTRSSLHTLHTLPTEDIIMQQPATVLADLGEWIICEDTMGEFYYHAPTNQSFDNPPPELVHLYQQQEEKHRENQLEQLRQQLHLHERLKQQKQHHQQHQPQVQQPVLAEVQQPVFAVQPRIVGNVGSSTYSVQPSTFSTQQAPPMRVMYQLQPAHSRSVPPVQQVVQKTNYAMPAQYSERNGAPTAGTAVQTYTMKSGAARYRS